MTHLPPEHPDSPASPFAPFQPQMGVVADDVPDEQNPGGGPKAADVSKKLGAEQRKAREDAEKEAVKAAEESQKQMADHLENRETVAGGGGNVVEDGVVKASKAPKSSS